MTTVIFLHPDATPDHVGMIPDWLNEDDPRPAKEQIHTAYAHGGGWHDMTGFTLDKASGALLYPGDPPFVPLATMKLRDEIIVAYEHSIFAILQADGSFVAARLD